MENVLANRDRALYYPLVIFAMTVSIQLSIMNTVVSI